MSDKRYAAGILKGCAEEAGGHSLLSVHGWPWPAECDLGTHKGGQPFAPCLDCPSGRKTWTWSRYGTAPLCVTHARVRARRMEETGA